MVTKKMRSQTIMNSELERPVKHVGKHVGKPSEEMTLGEPKERATQGWLRVDGK